MWGSVYMSVIALTQYVNLRIWKEIEMTHDFGRSFGRFYWVEGWIHVKLLCSDSETFGLLTGSLLVKRLKKRAV